jgi:hypothetical protein
MTADGLSVTTVEFQLRGRPGSIRVCYGVNEDPERWGYPLLGFDPLVDVSRGFPVVQADVDYAAEGYAAILSWIQILRTHDLDTGEDTAVIDGPPQLAGLDMPYVTFGPRPVFFDAPSTNATCNMDWDAQATLVASPDCLMTRHVQPVCGFGWGFRLRDGQPHPSAVRELDDAAWREDRVVLAEKHPSWTFE